MHASEQAPTKLTVTHWLILVVASLGFAFDIYELLMMPLIAGPALAELLGEPPGSPLVTKWIGYIFWGSAMSGGALGLLGGWLTDRFGRRRVLTGSILLYAISAFLAAYSTSATMLLILRCTTFMGVCVEFVAAVAWLAELFPNPKQREAVLGYTQAFSSFGGLLVTAANALAVQYADDLFPIMGTHSAWRYTLMSGLFPAIPLILIRPFLPESPAWREKRAAGTLKRPSFAELFAPQLRRTTIVTTALFACAYGAAFGALQLTPTQIVPGLPEVAPLQEQSDAAKAKVGKAAAQLKSLDEADPARKVLAGELATLRKEAKIAGDKVKQYGNSVQLSQELGGLVGRFLLAFLAVRIAARGTLLRIFQIPGLLIIPLLYFYPAQHSYQMLVAGIFLAGICTVGQFSFWGNYLPRVFPLHLRGTGESFAANVGGRMIGTSAALVTTQMSIYMPGDNSFQRVAYAAAATSLVVYLVGLCISFWLPEPPADNLPD